MQNILIVMPVFNDWQALQLLIPQIEMALEQTGVSVRILVADDGSLLPGSLQWDETQPFKRIQKIDVLHLIKNVGHQRAIAVALTYIQHHDTCDAIVVMDADGEDQPKDILRLIEAGQRASDHVVFASRIKRSEGLGFRSFYVIYKVLFRLLTGFSISFGNFSLIPFPLLKRLVFEKGLWNHFAAGVMRSKTPVALIPAARGSRLNGQSKMNLTTLILHGMYAISVYTEVVAVRLMLFAIILFGVSCTAIAIVFGIRIFTTLAIPGWASYVVLGFLSLLIQTLEMSIILIFWVLNTHSWKEFIPYYDYQQYVSDIEEIL